MTAQARTTALDLDDAPVGAIAAIPGWLWIRMPEKRAVDQHPWFVVERSDASADRTVWYSTDFLRRLGARITHLPVPIDAGAEPSRPHGPFRRGVDELTDIEIDEAIWAASPYRVAPGVGVSATPEAREQARRLYDVLAAQLRVDGPRADDGTYDPCAAVRGEVAVGTVVGAQVVFIKAPDDDEDHTPWLAVTLAPHVGGYDWATDSDVTECEARPLWRPTTTPPATDETTTTQTGDWP